MDSGRFRRFRFVYWMAAGASALVLAIWCFSVVAYVGCRFPVGAKSWNLSLGRGEFYFWREGPSPPPEVDFTIGRFSLRRAPVWYALGLVRPRRLFPEKGIALPLWILWMALALPLGAVTIQRTARKSAEQQAMSRRLSVQASLQITAPVYVVCLVALVWTLDEAATYWGWSVLSGRAWVLKLAVTMFVIMFVPYLPARYLHYKLHPRRVDANVCPACGYNLTGNISGRCPECGRPIERKNVSQNVA